MSQETDRVRYVAYLPPLPSPLLEQVSAAASSIAMRGAVPIRELTKTHRPADERRFLEALAQRGFQRVGTRLRAPLDEQLSRLLAEEELVPVSHLRKRLKGAGPKSEIDHLVERMAADERLALVYLDRKLQVTARVAEVRKPDAALDTFLKELKKALTNAKRSKKRSLYLPTLRALAQEAGLAHEASAASSQPASSVEAMVDLALADRAHELLSFLPELLRDALGEQVHDPETVAAAMQHLQGLEDAGEIELRVDSAMGGMSAADRRLCVIAGDLVLSTLRQLRPRAPR